MIKSVHEIPSIHEILTRAFNDIKLHHEVAVTNVQFDVITVGGIANIDYRLQGLSIDCIPCPAKQDYSE